MKSLADKENVTDGQTDRQIYRQETEHCSLCVNLLTNTKLYGYCNVDIQQFSRGTHTFIKLDQTEVIIA